MGAVGLPLHWHVCTTSTSGGNYTFLTAVGENQKVRSLRVSTEAILCGFSNAAAVAV